MTAENFDPIALIEALDQAGAHYVVVGAVAMAAHGAIRATTDLDVLVRQTTGNRERLAMALTRIHAQLKGAPRPSRTVDPRILELHRTQFTTDHGDLDVLTEVDGPFTYSDVSKRALVSAASQDTPRFRYVDRETLIAMKRASGRPQDLVDLERLEALRHNHQSDD